MPYHVLKPTKLADRIYMPGEQLPDDVDRGHVLVEYGYVTPIGTAAGKPGAGLGGQPDMPMHPEVERRLRELDHKVEALRRERADRDLKLEEHEQRLAELRREAETVQGELLAARDEATRLRQQAEGPPSIPAPLRVPRGSGAPELDQSPASPEEVDRHYARLKRAAPTEPTPNDRSAKK
jgi:hypothetical protein